MESRNQATIATTQKETEPMKTNLTIDNINNQQTPIVPNNQVCGASALPPRTPIPLESLKCNILKAKSLELGKNSNLVSISSTETTTATPEKIQPTDAATIVAVVSFLISKFSSSFFIMFSFNCIFVVLFKQIFFLNFPRDRTVLSGFVLVY